MLVKIYFKKNQKSEIVTFKFLSYVAHKFTQSGAMFKRISGSVFEHRVVPVVSDVT